MLTSSLQITLAGSVQVGSALMTDGKLQEGYHYQCVFYGGRLLSHLSAAASGERVEVLSVNRNAVVVMDSDRSSESDEINATKKRLLDEVTKAGGIAWVSHGREIENYIPPNILAALYPKLANVRPPSRFERLADYFSALEVMSADAFAGKKVEFAEQVAPKLEKEALAVDDLATRISEVIDYVRLCNGLTS